MVAPRDVDADAVKAEDETASELDADVRVDTDVNVRVDTEVEEWGTVVDSEGREWLELAEEVDSEVAGLEEDSWALDIKKSDQYIRKGRDIELQASCGGVGAVE